MKYLRLLIVTALMCAYLKGERRAPIVVREEGMGWEDGEPLPVGEAARLHLEIQETLLDLDRERSEWSSPPFTPGARFRWQMIQSSKPDWIPTGYKLAWLSQDMDGAVSK